MWHGYLFNYYVTRSDHHRLLVLALGLAEQVSTVVTVLKSDVTVVVVTVIVVTPLVVVKIVVWPSRIDGETVMIVVVVVFTTPSKVSAGGP